jgi:phosphopantothenoylcysteine decarboxylase/phosphopantothenate--cysteine ligase
VQALSDSFRHGRLAGTEVLVTAGPTREPLDPVRYLSNRSSGRMGYAVAEAARAAGANVRLVSGPVQLPAPDGVPVTAVETAQEMLETVLPLARRCDIFIAAAAVADYRPAAVSGDKLKRRADKPTLALEPAADILAAVTKLASPPYCVGFAAETRDLQRQAQKKRLSKGVDMIAANLVGPGLGFDSDENALLLVWEGGQLQLERDTKTRLAVRLVECIADHYLSLAGSRQTESHATHSTENSR